MSSAYEEVQQGELRKALAGEFDDVFGQVGDDDDTGLGFLVRQGRDCEDWKHE